MDIVPVRVARDAVRELRSRDQVALDEIELYAEVIIAAAASQGPLTREQLDTVLGLRPAGSGGGSAGLRQLPDTARDTTRDATRDTTREATREAT